MLTAPIQKLTPESCGDAALCLRVSVVESFSRELQMPLVRVPRGSPVDSNS